MTPSIRDTLAHMSDAALAEQLRIHGQAIWVIQAEMMRRAENGQDCDNVHLNTNEDESPQSEAGQPDDLLPKKPSV